MTEQTHEKIRTELEEFDTQLKLNFQKMVSTLILTGNTRAAKTTMFHLLRGEKLTSVRNVKLVYEAPG